MVMLGHIYLNLYKYYKDESYLEDVNFFVSWLLENAIKENNTLGWARTIDYQFDSQQSFVQNNSLTFINSKVLKLFLDLYEITEKKEYLQNAKKIADHFIKKTTKISSSDGICLSYASKSKVEIYNASLLAGVQLNRIYNYIPDEDYYSLSLSILRYSLNKQNEDGSWYYSTNGKKQKKQIDFHQVYMLMGIKEYSHHNLSEQITIKFKKGLNFYLNKMFDKNGIPYWRYPLKFPIDIHNISHAILFLSTYNIRLDRVNSLLFILINEFYDQKDKFFYCHKWLFVKNKINYFRWNTIWTLYSITTYLDKQKTTLQN